MENRLQSCTGSRPSIQICSTNHVPFSMQFSFKASTQLLHIVCPRKTTWAADTDVRMVHALCAGWNCRRPTPVSARRPRDLTLNRLRS